MYLKVKVNGKTKVFTGTNDSVNVSELKTYLKFYDNGKVAMFERLDTTSINPKKAIMGYYCMKDNENQFKFVFYHVQSGIFISNRLFEIKGDTIVAYSKKTAMGGGNKYFYVRTPIDKKKLIYKPDW